MEELGGERTLCLGNGHNDIPMFEESVLSIGIIEGIKLILNENMVKATLRN